MSPIDSLPPEQRAVLSLVLEKGRGYGEIATLLRIEQEAVRWRAHKALDALGPRDGTPPSPQRRAKVGDYLLGQQSDAEASRTREYLEGSASGRAWARVVAGELRGMAPNGMPEIPNEGAPADTATAVEQSDAPAAPAPPADTARPPISRRGGALLLGALLVIAAAVVAIVLATGSSSPKRQAATTPAAGASGASGPSGATGSVRIIAQINLKPPSASQHQIGVAQLFRQGSNEALAFAVTGLPPTHGFAYGVWLYNNHRSALRLGFAPAVTANGRLVVGTPVPSNVARYRAIIITRETSNTSTRPGPIVLAGPIPASAAR